MNLEFNVLFNSFIELNKTKSLAPGETSGSLARSINFYKKRIKEIHNLHSELTYPLLIKTHTQLAIIHATTSNCCHMIKDSIYFLERLISQTNQKYLAEFNESNLLNKQNNELQELMQSGIELDKLKESTEILKESIKFNRRMLLKHYATDSEKSEYRQKIYAAIYLLKLLRKSYEF